MILKVKIILLLYLLSITLYGCSANAEYFSEKELADYKSPILFLTSEDSEEKYFITLDKPSNKVVLDYSNIWDYDAVRQTFLFSKNENEEEKIYEYDLKNGNFKCIIAESDIIQYLHMLDEDEFKSIYYHFSDCQISGVYGEVLFVYDIIKKEFTYKMNLPSSSRGEICAWINSQTFLYRISNEVFEFHIDSGDMKRLENDLGFALVLSDDRTMGCSYGDENWFGIVFSPILVWDVADYNMKQLREGIVSSARMQISDDNRYIMFARSNINTDNQVLCIKIEDESLCTVYETEDTIIDLLW